jgi:cell volume regulation protein A
MQGRRDEDRAVDTGVILLAVGGILAASVVVALVAGRLGVPSLVAFLGLGMLLGSEGLGGIEFGDVHLARTVGVIGLAAIIYEGGLSTSWRRLRQVAAPAVLLSTVGVTATALLVAPAAHLLFHLPWLQSVLMGAIVSSTDAAAVFATLRFTTIRRRLARTLEAETGLNDPVAIALTLGLISWIQTRHSGFGGLLIEVVRELGLGLVAGVTLAVAAAWLFARLPTTIGAFAPVASLAAAALAYGLADVMGGSGFLAVYLVGLAVGSTPSRFRRQIVAFHEGLAFLAQVGLFIAFGLLVFPHRLGAVAGTGLALAVLLVVVIRPLAVWIATACIAFTARERILLGWAGLRGAAPIVLATFALSARIDKSGTIFDAVFFVVVVSTLLQGTTLEWLARRLRLVDGGPPPAAPPLEVDTLGPLELVEFDVTLDHAIAGATVSELGLPQDAIVAVVSRGTDSIPPRGSTRIQSGDRLYVLAHRSHRPELEDVFARWRQRI